MRNIRAMYHSQKSKNILNALNNGWYVLKIIQKKKYLETNILKKHYNIKFLILIIYTNEKIKHIKSSVLK